MRHPLFTYTIRIRTHKSVGILFANTRHLSSQDLPTTADPVYVLLCSNEGVKWSRTHENFIYITPIFSLDLSRAKD